MRTPLETRRRQRTERGAVAILTALCLTALVIATAMVLDFGLARLDKQTNKSIADASSLAGASAMNEDLSTPLPWVGACTAVRYLKAEFARLGYSSFSDSWSTAAGVDVSNPCSTPGVLDDLCTPNTESTWARYRGVVGSASDPTLIVQVKAGYEVDEDGFSVEGDYTNLAIDPGEPTSGGCDQLAVIVRQPRQPGLGSLATTSDVTTTIRSVGRVIEGEEGKSPVALLILERHDCAAIETNGNTTQLFVRGAGIRPGLIHSDSIGDTPGNTGGCNSKKIVGGTGTIKAFKAPVGDAAGVIGIRALKPDETGAVPANAYDAPPAVVAEGSPGDKPEGRPLVTRAPVDERYLTAVTSRATSAAAQYTMSPATAALPANGYTVKTTCGGGSGLTGDIAGSRLFFDCPSGLIVDNSKFTQATSVVVNGPLTIKSGGLLSLPLVTELIVKGPGTSSLTTPGFDNAGTFLLHHADKANCAAADTDNPSGRAEFVLGSGFFKQTATGAVLRMCHTTMITMGNDSSMPVFSDYADPSAAPANNPRNGHLSVNGGTIDWSAPNSKPGTPASQTDWDNFEDLAFWTETSESSSIGGNGFMTLRGIFMLPNANPFNIGGTGGQNVRDSQYIVRKLRANGGGVLEMQPDPNDAVSVDYFGDYVLVR